VIKASICLILAAVGAGTGWWIVNSQADPLPAMPPRSAPVDRVDTSLPNADLSPEDVVRIQLESWRASADNPDALVAAYSMASPQNREVTGPFERFSRMVASEPFSALPIADQWLIGAAHIEGNFATVLVSLTLGDDLSAFRFYLRKQDLAPYTDCWMTDSVEPQVLADLPTEEN